MVYLSKLKFRYACKRVKIKDIDSGAFQQLEMVILAPEDLYTTELYSSLKEIDRVVSVEVESR